MTAIDPPSGLDEMSGSTPISVTDERKIGLSQHRFFCECGNVITAPSASAYIEAAAFATSGFAVRVGKASRPR